MTVKLIFFKHFSKINFFKHFRDLKVPSVTYLQLKCFKHKKQFLLKAKKRCSFKKYITSFPKCRPITQGTLSLFYSMKQIPEYTA